MTNINNEELQQALRKCESEAIHNIGHIQSHGALLVLSSDKHRIVLQASLNLSHYIDIQGEEICGKRLNELIGVVQCEQIEQLIKEVAETKSATKEIGFIHQQTIRKLQARIFSTDNLFVLELINNEDECQYKDFAQRLLQFQRSMLALNLETDISSYFRRVANHIRELIEFDRVMIYRFDEHWDGEVIAESRVVEAKSYLGTRFPASDIPPQARHLYTINLVRQISAVGTATVPILPALNPRTQLPLDMTHSVLRSLSPVHVEYLQNMGVSASMSISLLLDGRLWGLIACHHLTAKQVPYSFLETANFISQTISAKLFLINIQERHNFGLEATRIISNLLKDIASNSETNIQETLLPDLQKLLDATGIVLTVEGKIYTYGITPDPATLNDLMTWLGTQATQGVYVSHHLEKAYPPSSAFSEIVSGLLGTQLSNDMRNSLVWLKKERFRNVQWAGSPEKTLLKDTSGIRLSPRKSFQIFTEAWSGRCDHWSKNQKEIAEFLAQGLTEALSQKSKLDEEKARRKQADEDVKKIQALLNEAERIGNVGGWELNIETKKMSWTKGAYDIHEAECGPETKLENSFNFYTPESKPIIKQAMYKACEHGEPFDLELEIVTAKGNRRAVHIIGNVDSMYRRVYGFIQDITDRKQKESQIRKYMSIVESTNDAIIGKNLHGIIESWNQGAENLFGYTATEMIGLSMQTLIPPDRLHEEKNIIKSISLGKRVSHYDTVRRHKDGSMLDVSMAISPIINETGRLTGASNICRDISDRKKMERDLQEREIFLNTITNNVPGLVAYCDRNLRYTFANNQYITWFGRTQSEMQGIHIRDLLGSKLFDLNEPFIRAVLQGQNQNFEQRLTKPNGETHATWSQYIAHKIDDEVVGFFVLVTDISALKQSEESLLIAATAFELQEGMVITDAKTTILRVNRTFTEITGYTTEELVGQSPRLLESGRHDAEFYRVMWKSINTTGGWKGEVWNKRKNGEIYPATLTISSVKNETGIITHYVAAQTDITIRKRADDMVKELAFFDQLTGLPNRRLFLDRLQQVVTATCRDDSFGAVLLLDLDHFKTLNDTLGHDYGDLLLQQVSKRLTGCLRSCDTVSRWGGDEFVVVLSDLEGDGNDAAAHVKIVGEKILFVINQAFQLKDTSYHCTGSIGATLFKGLSVAIDDLLKQSDLAMYQSKSMGRNSLHFFDPTMAIAIKERSEQEDALRHAFERNQFELFFQPQILQDGQVTGAEALVRWHHPQRGMVLPIDFISTAEETGLILPLGQWVIKTVCQQLVLWASDPLTAQLTIAVNVSVRQFSDAGFVDQILEALNNSGADPHLLKLELTESLLADNIENIIKKMLILKKEGVAFSLDDFGTGYSSLSYLQRLPLDQLKIDRSFVSDVLVNPNDAAIAKTIIALAQTLGLSVIAEGVETEEQKNFLLKANCIAYQGHLFSPPIPIDEFEEFLRHT